MKETIITIELPLKRIPNVEKKWRLMLPLRDRYFGWLFAWNRSSIQEFGGSRVNTAHRLQLFRWHLLTIRRNEYHDQSDKERADKYLRKWSECEKQLKMFRLASLGEGAADDVKRVIKESLGVDLDEGTIR